jgi:hypothetical protein
VDTGETVISQNYTHNKTGYEQKQSEKTASSEIFISKYLDEEHKDYNNKKFWEELGACFPLCDKDRIDNDAFNNSSAVACVFVAAVTFLPNRCLATIRGYTRRHTE